ncbi:hypothetical protein JavanS175_0010 [Streptococcus satellite phage Javan175]|uniref:hypothetical protein n=1 Tax=Streptococcus entericus TaxID=155680 RepID=UPI000376CAEB|nr:hypothetical protein [Streptococcus entericus]QBX07751.1 hypothetical protein JavanS175_0010 [Streptococcus satellite phage Javan175]
MTDTIILTLPQFWAIMAVLLPLVMVLWHKMLTLTPEDKAELAQLLQELEDRQGVRP